VVPHGRLRHEPRPAGQQMRRKAGRTRAASLQPGRSERDVLIQRQRKPFRGKALRRRVFGVWSACCPVWVQHLSHGSGSGLDHHLQQRWRNVMPGGSPVGLDQMFRIPISLLYNGDSATGTLSGR
jgi:hypothetical protein